MNLFDLNPAHMTKEELDSLSWTLVVFELHDLNAVYISKCDAQTVCEYKNLGDKRFSCP